MQQTWFIEARFKSVGGPWIRQAMEPFATAEDAQAKVDQLTQRNTLSEWRTIQYVSAPSEPEAAVSEGNKEPICGACGYVRGVCQYPLNQSEYPHRFEPYAAQPVSEGPNDGTCCDNGKFGEPHDCCKQCDDDQPQPAGTEPRVARYGVAYEDYQRLQAELAALQQSHDECVKVLEDIQANFFRRLAKNFPKLNTAIRTALANAEKLRAAK